nr:GerAB/ArcD/ProY family transporter [Desulforamulus aquiferis]
MYPGQSLVQYSESIMGWPGKILSLIIIWFSFHLAALVLRNLGNFVSLVLLYETPLPLIHVLIVAVTIYGIRLGIETIARALSFLLTVSFIFFLLIQAYSMAHVDLENLLPVLGQGFLPVISATLQMSAFPVGELVIFSLIFFHIKPSPKTGRFLTGGLLISLFILFMAIERIISFMGPDMASRQLYGIMGTIGGIRGGNLFETMVAINWYAFTITKFLVCYYAFMVGLAHWFKLPDYRPLLLPAGALITVFSLFLYEMPCMKFILPPESLLSMQFQSNMAYPLCC